MMRNDKSRRCFLLLSVAGVLCLLGQQADAEVQKFVVEEINPDRSTLDKSTRTARRADVSTICRLRAETARCSPPANGAGCSAPPTRASTWQHLPGHVSSATWDVAVDPETCATHLCHVVLRRQGCERRGHQRQLGWRQLLVPPADRDSACRFLSHRGAPRRTVRFRHQHQSRQPQKRFRRHELRPGDQRRSRPDVALRGSDPGGRRRRCVGCRRARSTASSI